MPGQLHHLADRLLNTPLLIHPAKAEVLLAVLAGRMGIDGDLGVGLGIEATRFVGSARRESGRSALTRATNGVAIVPVLDTLVNRGAWLDSPPQQQRATKAECRYRVAATNHEPPGRDSGDRHART